MAAANSPPRAGEVRRDPIFDRWVIFSPSRAGRPTDLNPHSPSPPTPNPSASCAFCAFCLGRESECAPEIFRFPPSPAAGEWRIRVIENLYPAVRRDSPAPHLDIAGTAGFVSLPGFGFHDVVIETPHHLARLWELTAEEVGGVLLAYKERILQLAGHNDIKYVQVFKNYGASAGASLAHSHSQIIGTPFVPPSVSARLNIMKETYEKTHRCSLCEYWTEGNLVDDTPNFFAATPFAPSYPFEIWIIPRKHSPFFHDTDNNMVTEFGSLLKLVLWKLSKHLGDPPFNYMVHSAPFNLPSSHLPATHWFLQIVPKLNVIGGFEIGSGCHINPVFPEDAAEALRKVYLSE